MKLIGSSLTAAVAEEAVNQNASLIISYHPPIFKPLLRLTLMDPLQTSLLLCASEGISIYSPHSALDSAKSGINDWLAAAFPTPTKVTNIEELSDRQQLGGLGRRVQFVNRIQLQEVASRIKKHLDLDSSDYHNYRLFRSNMFTLCSQSCVSSGSKWERLCRKRGYLRRIRRVDAERCRC